MNPLENPKKENPMQIITRISSDLTDYLNQLISRVLMANTSSSDEEMRQKFKQSFEEFPIIPYMEYLAKHNSKTTKAEIDLYLEDYDKKINHIYERIKAEDLTKEEFLDLFNDLRKYVSLNE